MSSAPQLPAQPGSNAEVPHFPHTKVEMAARRVHINSGGRLQMCIGQQSDGGLYVAEGSLDGMDLGGPCFGSTPTRALLGMTAQFVDADLLTLPTLLLLGGSVSRIEVAPSLRAVALERGCAPIYVVLGAFRLRRHAGHAWYGSSGNFITSPPGRKNSFEALLEGIDHMVESGIWP